MMMMVKGYDLRDYSQKGHDNGGVIYSSNLFEPFRTTSKGIFSSSERPIAFNGGIS